MVYETEIKEKQEMRKQSIKESAILVILFAPVVFMLFVWNKLPESLPVHWNIRGEIDGYGPKYLFPLMSIALYVIFIMIPKIDPRKRNYTIFSATYYKLRLILTLFMSMFISVVIINSLYVRIQFERLIPASVLLLLAAIGNYLGTVRSNFFIGIRTPWTLDNEEVWRKTHLLGGRIWFFGGITGALAALFFPHPFSEYFALGCVVLMVIVPVLYSYFCFRNLEKARTV